MEGQGDGVDQGLIRGMNWAPNSCDEADDSSASEVCFVMDSLAGETEVPDSQETCFDVDERVAADALVELQDKEIDAITSLQPADALVELHGKEIDPAVSLLLPLFFPLHVWFPR
ncbi:unnamed protein product [Urochloa decumbens]|uniref:Uncharacterized protein n=1 Tax=Urochloa decumbens TaxID=240449 RepID=A0ABC9BLK4_9POAL